MAGYTVFDHTEVDEPKAQNLSLEQAFLMVCQCAGFRPAFRRDGGVLYLEFDDETGGSREQVRFHKAHPIYARARRELMQKAISTGVWGMYAAPDEQWRKEVNAPTAKEAQPGVPFARTDLDEQCYPHASVKPSVPTLHIAEDGSLQIASLVS